MSSEQELREKIQAFRTKRYEALKRKYLAKGVDPSNLPAILGTRPGRNDGADDNPATQQRPSSEASKNTIGENKQNMNAQSHRVSLHQRQPITNGSAASRSGPPPSKPGSAELRSNSNQASLARKPLVKVHGIGHPKDEAKKQAGQKDNQRISILPVATKVTHAPTMPSTGQHLNANSVLRGRPEARPASATRKRTATAPMPSLSGQRSNRFGTQSSARAASVNRVTNAATPLRRPASFSSSSAMAVSANRSAFKRTDETPFHRHVACMLPTPQKQDRRPFVRRNMLGEEMRKSAQSLIVPSAVPSALNRTFEKEDDHPAGQVDGTTSSQIADTHIAVSSNSQEGTTDLNIVATSDQIRKCESENAETEELDVLESSSTGIIERHDDRPASAVSSLSDENGVSDPLMRSSPEPLENNRTVFLDEDSTPAPRATAGEPSVFTIQVKNVTGEEVVASSETEAQPGLSTEEVVSNDLVNLLEEMLFLQQDLPASKARSWLARVEEKYPQVKKHSMFWIAKSRLVRKKQPVEAVEILERALAEGAEPITLIDEELTEIRTKFSLTPARKTIVKSPRLLREVDSANITESRVIAYEVKLEKLIGDMSELSVKDVSKAVATPVRRSTRQNRRRWGSPGSSKTPFFEVQDLSSLEKENVEIEVRENLALQ